MVNQLVTGCWLGGSEPGVSRSTLLMGERGQELQVPYAPNGRLAMVSCFLLMFIDGWLGMVMVSLDRKISLPRTRTIKGLIPGFGSS